MTTTTTTTTKHFRILDFPTELRLNNYSHYMSTFIPPSTDPAKITGIEYAAPSINTCKLIRHEAAKLYYARLKEVVPGFKRSEDELWQAAETYLDEQLEDFDLNEYESIQTRVWVATSESAYAQRAVDREAEILRKDGYEVKAD